MKLITFEVWENGKITTGPNDHTIPEDLKLNLFHLKRIRHLIDNMIENPQYYHIISENPERPEIEIRLSPAQIEALEKKQILEAAHANSPSVEDFEKKYNERKNDKPAKKDS